jgi:hypothetical protein
MQEDGSPLVQSPELVRKNPKSLATRPLARFKLSVQCDLERFCLLSPLSWLLSAALLSLPTPKTNHHQTTAAPQFYWAFLLRY